MSFQDSHVPHDDSNRDDGNPSERMPDPAAPRLSDPGLMVMDVDSTLIDEEVIDELGKAAGLGERIARLTRQAMEGGMDFRQALDARVSLLEGLPLSVLDDVYAGLHFTPGAVDLIDTLHSHGWKVGVVSGGFHEIVDRLAHDARIDHWLANGLGVRDGVLTGRLRGDVVTRDTKLAALRQWAHDDGIPMSQTVAIGDGANDVPMIREARLGIAFCAKPGVQKAAPHRINVRDLRLVLDYLR